MKTGMVDCVETAARVVSTAWTFRTRTKARVNGVLVAELIRSGFRYDIPLGAWYKMVWRILGESSLG